MVDSTLLACGLDASFDMRNLNIERGQAGAGREGQMALINLYYFAVQSLNLLRQLVFQRPVIVHQSVTDSIGFWKESCFMLLARCMGVQVVAHVHGNRLEPQYLAAHPMVRRLMRGALSLPNAVVVLNEHYLRFLSGIVAPSTRFAVVPNSVDPDIATAMECTSRESKESPTVLFIGFIGSRKGVPDALRAIPLVRSEHPECDSTFG
jgi:glycosyltransferase involved in cell wall biosynthesis